MSRLREAGHAIGRTAIYEWMNGQHLPEDTDQFPAAVRSWAQPGERQADLCGATAR